MCNVFLYSGNICSNIAGTRILECEHRGLFSRLAAFSEVIDASRFAVITFGSLITLLVSPLRQAHSKLLHLSGPTCFLKISVLDTRRPSVIYFRHDLVPLQNSH